MRELLRVRDWPYLKTGDKMAKVIFINAEQQKVEIRETNGLESLQALVGGMIEPVHFVKLGGRDLLCVNEEGLYMGFEYGFTLDGNQFVGNGFIGTLEKADAKFNPASLVGRLGWLAHQPA